MASKLLRKIHLFGNKFFHLLKILDSLWYADIGTYSSVLPVTISNQSCVQHYQELTGPGIEMEKI